VFTVWTLQPRHALHDETPTIIKCRYGEIDIDRWSDGHTVTWWQDADCTVNVRPVTLPPW